MTEDCKQKEKVCEYTKRRREDLGLGYCIKIYNTMINEDSIRMIIGSEQLNENILQWRV
jgi:hypothetical protein